MNEEEFLEDLEDSISNPVTKYEPIMTDKRLMPLSLIERQIIELHSFGKSKKEIAVDTGLPISVITKTLNKPNVAEIVADMIYSWSTAQKAERIRLLNRIVEDKIAKVEQSQDYSELTKKDVVDLIETIDDMLKEREKKELGVESSTYVNILQQIRMD